MLAKQPVPAPPKDDLTRLLIRSFKGLISDGALQPGGKLPPERDLARRFGVARSSLRHALKVMEVMGVITQRVGDGTYLSGNASQILSEPLDFLLLIDGISLFEVLETRLLVEPEMAARAAERATLAHLHELKSSLDVMKSEKDNALLIASDLAFHQTIFRASGNRLAERIFSMIHRAMATSISVTSQLVDWNHTLRFHEPIYQAIDRRKPDLARRKTVEHLEDARRLLQQASGQKMIPEVPVQLVRLERRKSLVGRTNLARE